MYISLFFFVCTVTVCSTFAGDIPCNCPNGWENAINGRSCNECKYQHHQHHNDLAACMWYKRISYDLLPDDVNVPNPGRGFFKQSSGFASNFRTLGPNVIAADRTVVQIMFYMDKYINSSLDEEWIRNVKSDLNFLQQQGWMGLLRFSYTNHRTGVHDAGLQRILEHIEYLTNSSLLTQYEGVIAAVQVGFIGVWGEWYYGTDDFGKPGRCSSDLMFGMTTSQWTAREKVLRAVLHMVPKSIQVELRYPWLKYKMFGNTPTSLQDVLNRTDKGRVGFHNDAFLSTEANMGTYKCAGDKSYLARETQYLVMSGETNDNRTVSRYGCSNAPVEMAKYHFSMLNEGFLHQVVDNWRTHGCHDMITAKLGYRLFLINSTFPSSVQSGGEICFEVNLGNNGFAAPYKKMDLQLVLQNTNNDRTMYNSTIRGYELRTLLPGQTLTVKGQIGVPRGLHGVFKVFLAITDDIMKYDDNYYVMLANKNVNSSSVRINDLMHTINVTRGTCRNQNGDNLVPWNGPKEGCRPKTLSDGSFEDDALGWKPNDDGFKVIQGSDAQHGNKYIQISNGAALHVLDFTRHPIYHFTLSGYSRLPNNTVVNTWWKYRIKCDLFHTDGSKTWASFRHFPQNKRDVWNFEKLTVHSQRAIKTARCYLEFSNGTGHVDFDNFVLNTCIDTDCNIKFHDGSFEDGSSWSTSGQYIKLRSGRTDAHDGDSYMAITNGSAYQTIHLTSLSVTEVSISGYSRPHNVKVNSPSDYSISCDMQLTDGTTSTGHIGLFDPTGSPHTWQQTVLNMTTTQPISTLTCYARLRDAHGSADFDDFRILSCL